MKKLIFFLIILVVNVFGQDVNRVVNTTFYRDTLTATKDTIQLKFQAGFDYFTISTYSAATDTIYVYTKGEGNYGIWTQKALIDLSNSSISTQIISTSTPKEYLIQVPSTMWLLIITPDGSANTVFTVNAYKGLYAINGSTPSSLPLPSGAATSDKQDSTITLLNSQIVKLLNISANSEPATKFFADRKTITTTGVDSISVSTATTWVSFSLFAVDDDLQFSLDKTNWGIVLPYMTASLEKISPITYPKIYIKQRDGLGTMNYDIIWIGR